MLIEINNNFSCIKEGELPKHWFASKVHNSWFSSAYKKGVWDGKINFLSKNNYFLSGFMPFLLTDFPEIQIVDKRQYPHLCHYTKLQEIKTKLRDYQMQAALQALEKKRGIFWMATNAGKTLIFAALLKTLGGQATVLTYGLTLLQQTKNILEKELDEEIGLLTGKSSKIPQTRIIVASINTVEKRNYNLLEDILILDECHLASSDAFFKYGKLSKAYFRWGFSGTALKTKTKNAYGLNAFYARDTKLIGLTGPVIAKVSNADLIDKGYSAKPIIHLHSIESVQASNYFDAYELGWVCNPFLLSKIEKIVDTYPKKHVLILTIRLDQGNLLAERLKKRFVCGDTIKEDRKFYPHEKVLIASSIFDMGLNLPIDHLILAGGQKGDEKRGKNANRLLQRIGRALRKKKKENIVHIHDFVPFGNKWLEKHALERINTYEKEGFDIVVE